MTYEQLLEDSNPAHGLRCRFETPVRLKINGHDSLLPAPRALWQGYAQRWETYSTIPLPPEFLRWVEEEVTLLDLRLDTLYGFIEKDIEWKGFMGEVSFQAHTDGKDLFAERAPEYLRFWQALAFLAEYCGTGEKTAMGMGRTRLVKVFGYHNT